MGQCFCTALHHLETHPSPEGPSDREDNGMAQHKEAIAEQPQMSDSESNGYVIIVTWRKFIVIEHTQSIFPPTYSSSHDGSDSSSTQEDTDN